MCKSASDEVQLGEADGSYESVDVNNDDLYLVTSPALVRPARSYWAHEAINTIKSLAGGTLGQANSIQSLSISYPAINWIECYRVIAIQDFSEQKKK